MFGIPLKCNQAQYYVAFAAMRERRSDFAMKVWLPLALGIIAVSAYALFYYLSYDGPGGGNSFGLVNSVGLAAVVVGIIVAGVILRRASPQT